MTNYKMRYVANFVVASTSEYTEIFADTTCAVHSVKRPGGLSFDNKNIHDAYGRTSRAWMPN